MVSPKKVLTFVEFDRTFAFDNYFAGQDIFRFPKNGIRFQTGYVLLGTPILIGPTTAPTGGINDITVNGFWGVVVEDVSSFGSLLLN
jgi:hypothetical protein